MEKIIPFLDSDLAEITNHRDGETKFGQKMQTIPLGVELDVFLETCSAKYVIFGIPEDIGVRANLGRVGAATCWDIAIKSIANLQHNNFCKADNILVLGKLNVVNEMKLALNLDENIKEDRKKLFNLVANIDKEVAHIITKIVLSNKIPIVIGGGHNNAYGCIKGTALALAKPINAINFDPHSDFRAKEGRHSGNGFSYTFDEGFLKKYFIFGLHESYNSKNVMQVLKENQSRIQFNTYEEIAIRKNKNFQSELKRAKKYIKDDKYGIEIDLDAIPNIASSAITNSGFSVEHLRRFTSYFGKNKDAAYIHICEGAPSLDNEKNNHLIGKLIAYLVSDFIKVNILKAKKPKVNPKQ